MKTKVLVLTVLVLALTVALPLLRSPRLSCAGLSHTWEYEDSADYTCDTRVMEVSGGTAHLSRLPLDDGWWTQVYDLPGSAYDALGVAHDADGDMAVVGHLTGGGFVDDMWVRKIDGTDGSTIWYRTFDSGGVDFPTAITCDPAGDFIVAAQVSEDAWIRKYEGATGHVLGTRSYDSGFNDSATGVACDGSGGIFVTGVTWGGPDPSTWAMKYDGIDGPVPWTKAYPYGNDPKVACDGAGDVFVSGTAEVRKHRGSDGVDIWAETGGFADMRDVSCDPSGNAVAVGGSPPQLRVGKFGGEDGELLWTATEDNPPDGFSSYSVFCDQLGDVLVSAGRHITWSTYDARVYKYSTDGDLLWSETCDVAGGSSHYPADVSTDSAGNAAVAGVNYGGSPYVGWVRSYPPDEYTPYSPPVTTLEPADLASAQAVGFAATEGPGNQGSFSFQLSPDGATWYYYDEGWKEAGGASSAHSNPAPLVNKRVGEFNAIAAEGLYVRALLTSNGTQEAELDSVEVALASSPRIDSVDPPEGYCGSTVRIKGTGFGSTKGNSFVDFNGHEIVHKEWSDTEIKIEIPEKPVLPIQEVMVVVKTAWGDSDPKAFTLLGTQARDTWYLADGSTAWGFDEYVPIMNPNNCPVEVELYIMEKGGGGGEGRLVSEDEAGTPDKTIPIDPFSRATVNVSEFAPDTDLSIKLSAKEYETSNPKNIVVERSMFASSNGVRKSGSLAVGTPNTSVAWYFAEGSTNWGFDTWLLVGNPNNEAVDVKVTYMLDTEAERSTVEKIHEIPPNSRETITARDEVGAADFSIMVECWDQNEGRRDNYKGIICERSTGRGDNMEMFDANLGTPLPSRTWHFAEGCTAWGFDTFLLLQNPGPGDASVHIIYFKNNGAPVMKEITIGAFKRETVTVSQDVGACDVSASLVSDKPIVAERAMYWKEMSGGHTTTGITEPREYVYFAEGSTAKMHGFQEYLCVQNPNDADIDIEIVYLTPCGPFAWGGYWSGGKVMRVFRVPKHSRATYNLYDDPFSGVKDKEIAIRLKDHMPGDAYMFLAERSLYWDDMKGGSVSIGHPSPIPLGGAEGIDGID